MWTELSPNRFAYDKYCGKMDISVDKIVYAHWTEKNHDKLILRPDATPIGYCDATLLKVRPRTSGYAIMVEIFGEETWMHVHELPNKF